MHGVLLCSTLEHSVPTMVHTVQCRVHKKWAEKLGTVQWLWSRTWWVSGCRRSRRRRRRRRWVSKATRYEKLERSSCTSHFCCCTELQWDCSCSSCIGGGGRRYGWDATLFYASAPYLPKTSPTSFLHHWILHRRQFSLRSSKIWSNPPKWKSTSDQAHFWLTPCPLTSSKRNKNAQAHQIWF